MADMALEMLSPEEYYQLFGCAVPDLLWSPTPFSDDSSYPFDTDENTGSQTNFGSDTDMSAPPIDDDSDESTGSHSDFHTDTAAMSTLPIREDSTLTMAASPVDTAYSYQMAMDPVSRPQIPEHQAFISDTEFQLPLHHWMVRPYSSFRHEIWYNGHKDGLLVYIGESSYNKDELNFAFHSRAPLETLKGYLITSETSFGGPSLAESHRFWAAQALLYGIDPRNEVSFIKQRFLDKISVLAPGCCHLTIPKQVVDAEDLFMGHLEESIRRMGNCVPDNPTPCSVLRHDGRIVSQSFALENPLPRRRAPETTGGKCPSRQGGWVSGDHQDAVFRPQWSL